MTNPTGWPDGLRVLAVRLDNFGDVLMTTPALRALKETWPHAHLTLLTSAVGAAVAPLIPAIDDVLTVDVPWMRDRPAPLPANGSWVEADVVGAFASQLRQRRFDAAVIFTVQSQSPLPAAMLCYLAGIPRVLGYCRENPYQLLTNWVPDPEVLVATRHEVTRQLALVETIGARPTHDRLSLRIPDNVVAGARRKLANVVADLARPWLLLHPGVSEEKRRYPADHYVVAARRLAQEQGYQIVLTGSASERPYCEAIREGIGPSAHNVAGGFSLPELAALIADAPVLIANNTGPVHLAAAVGTPVVVLYAKTNPQHTPWRVPSRVLYFDVPPALRSRNVLLQQFPEPTPATASPDAIVQAVQELVAVNQPPVERFMV